MQNIYLFPFEQEYIVSLDFEENLHKGKVFWWSIKSRYFSDRDSQFLPILSILTHPFSFEVNLLSLIFVHADK